MSGEANEIPLFPLHTVLFPGGPLTLRLFEPRYLDMVSRCLRDDFGFGVALIRQGGEVGGHEPNVFVAIRRTTTGRAQPSESTKASSAACRPRSSALPCCSAGW